MNLSTGASLLALAKSIYYTNSFSLGMIAPSIWLLIAPLKADLSCCSKRLQMLTVWEVKWRPPSRTLMALANNTFLLSYSPMSRSQVWILNYLVHGSSKITLLPHFLCFAVDARSGAGDSPYKIVHNDWLKIVTCCLLPWRNIDGESCTQIKTCEPSMQRFERCV